MRIGRRSGAQTIRCHRSRRIESCRRRKSLPATSAGTALYRQRHDRRSDHPAHRELPLPSRATARRASQLWLHAIVPVPARSSHALAPSCVHGTGGTVTLWWNGCRLRTGRGWSVFGARPHIGIILPQAIVVLRFVKLAFGKAGIQRRIHCVGGRLRNWRRRKLLGLLWGRAPNSLQSLLSSSCFIRVCRVALSIKPYLVS